LKLLRILILVSILLAAGAFIWLTAGSDARTLLFDRLILSDQRLVYVMVVLCVLTLLSTLTGLPIFYLSMAMGFLLKLAPGLLICWGVNLLSVMVAFLMVRSAFTGYFQKKYGEKKLIKRINRRISEYGLWTVAFSRGIYIIPTNVINFSFPLSSITPRSYLAGTAIGLVPECLVNILAGYLIKHEAILLSSPETSTWEAAIIGGFIFLLAVIFILFRRRQKRRRKFRSLKEIPFEG
jgi:uncharacterized membrane protein YdjX (TVP38/TMEM64 family)